MENKIDQIRDLVFGEHIQNYDKQLSGIDEKIKTLKQSFKDFQSKQTKTNDKYLNTLERLEDHINTLEKDLKNFQQAQDKTYSELSAIVHNQQDQIHTKLSENNFIQFMENLSQDIQNNLKSIKQQTPKQKVKTKTTIDKNLK